MQVIWGLASLFFSSPPPPPSTRSKVFDQAGRRERIVKSVANFSDPSPSNEGQHVITSPCMCLKRHCDCVCVCVCVWGHVFLCLCDLFNCNSKIILGTVNVISVRLCSMVLLTELWLFVTLAFITTVLSSDWKQYFILSCCHCSSGMCGSERNAAGRQEADCTASQRWS